MEFFNSAIDILKILVMALGAGLAVWGVIKVTGPTTPRQRARVLSSLWLIRCYNIKKGKAQSRRNRRCGQEILWKHKVSAIMGSEILTMEREAEPMHISYQPLWDTLKERGMRKEDLRLAAGLTTNMIANMGKGKHISMETLLRICGALECDIMDVISLEKDE